MMKYFTLIVSYILTISLCGFCQNGIDNSVKYDFYYRFNDGLFIEFSDLKNNNPIPFERIISPFYEDSSFFDSITKVKTISFFDNFGNLQEIARKEIWGYSRNGKAYVNLADKFYLIPSIGSISHFAALIKVYRTSGDYAPFYGSNYYYNNYYPTRTYEAEELQQFLIDFETGKIYPYNVQSVEILLSKNTEISNEYSKLSKRKKKKKIFEYIKRYNEIIPLYLPKN